jgi:zinc/manganese transport system substrate-binding protein/manganese/iron transport system substrate-binding protein
MARRPLLSRLLVGAGALVVAATVAAGCSDEPGPSSGRPLVVASTTQLADFARAVGGKDVEVYALLRPNVDAHEFEPSPADLDALARSSVVVRNGLGLDPWLDDAVAASGTSSPVVDTSRGAQLLGDDPHLWFDPRNAAVMVAHVADAIAEADPDAAAAVRRRATTYRRRLDELDRWIAQQLADLPARKLVTDHDAFGYYVRRYHLDFVGSIIPGFDSSAEISARDLNRLADRIRAEDVPAIFTEQSLPPKAAEALADRAGVEVVSGDDGLYGDSLGPDGSAGATYLGMMRHNTAVLVEHLR